MFYLFLSLLNPTKKDIDARGKLCVVDTDGRLFELENGKKEITLPVKAKRVTTQKDVVFIIDENGKLWTFGKGLNGTLGHGNTDDKVTPKLVEKLAHLKVKQIGVSPDKNFRVVCTTEDGRAYVWGQCGSIGLSDNELTPVELIRDHKN